MKSAITHFSFKFSITVVLMLSLLTFTQNSSAWGKSIFTDPITEEQCRGCHGDNKTLPHPKLQTPNAKRHHSRIGEPILGLARYDTMAPGRTEYGVYTCTTCHMKYNSDRGVFELFLTHDCLQCHKKSTVTGSPWSGRNVHHYTDTFYEWRCGRCHNFLSSTSSWGSTSGSTTDDRSYSRW